MTDPQTPATEAGRRLLGSEFLVKGDAFDGSLLRTILAIEAEGRADALREAADAVRGLGTYRAVRGSGLWTVSQDAVLAILDPQP